MVTVAAATVAVTAIALLVITGRPGSFTDPLGAAVAQVSAGRSGLVLMAAREKVIQQTAATEAFSVTSTPRISTVPSPVSTGGGGGSSALVPSGPAPSPSTAQGIAYKMLASFGFSTSQWGCLDDLWQQESGWNVYAENPYSAAYGIPQAVPGSKMSSAGPNWRSNARTQIRWGLRYIRDRYGSPRQAWAHEVGSGWY